MARLTAFPSDGVCEAQVQITATSSSGVPGGRTLNLQAPYIVFQPGFRVAAQGKLRAGSNYVDALRLLTQASFGPTREALNHVMALGGAEAWLEEQFNLPLERQLPEVRTLASRMCSFPLAGEPEYTDTYNGYARRQIWWEHVLSGDDQLRQRVAFALSQILVVSDIGQLGDYQFGMTDYWDTLLAHAFGNYRDLLKAVTLHPMMGEWLSSIRNRKADPQNHIHPDENYAREILQLFSIGLHQLQMDGSLRKDANGLPMPTYGQQEVKAFARVFTGLIYHYENPDFADDWEWRSPWSGAITTHPMAPLEENHDTGEKVLLDGHRAPAGGDTLGDIDAAIDIIFNHPNVPPFVSRQLIQRLVTSNPSPGYVERVANVFADNGNGVRGDLKAVVRAILLDPEARHVHPLSEDFGKLREPLLRFSHLWRLFGLPLKTHNGTLWTQEDCGEEDYLIYWIWWLDSFRQETGQDILGAPSVFNFFQPGYAPPGPVSEAGKLAPEFQIATESWLTGAASSMNWQLLASSWADAATYEWSILDLADEASWGASVEFLLKRLNLLLLNGQMNEQMRNILASHLDTVALDGEPADVLRDAILLIINSPAYLIQK